jgi:hypothetical protein
MMGFRVEFDHPHQIVRASSMTNLRAAYGTDDSPTHYSGPMVHKDGDNRVYTRFQRAHPGKYSTDNKRSVHTWPGHPEAVSGAAGLPDFRKSGDRNFGAFLRSTPARALGPVNGAARPMRTSAQAGEAPAAIAKTMVTGRKDLASCIALLPG